MLSTLVTRVPAPPALATTRLSLEDDDAVTRIRESIGALTSYRAHIGRQESEVKTLAGG
jgi:hypothetical protein